MNSKKFARWWYTTLTILLLAACAAFLGSRDTLYLGDKDAYMHVTDNPSWWESTVMMRTPEGKQWCSGVIINKDAYHPVYGEISYVVTARHCAKEASGGATISEMRYTPAGTVQFERRHTILEFFNHPSKDFTLLIVENHCFVDTPVYTGKIPNNRQDFIIGYRGASHGDYYQYGKHISPAYAYKGQSGGGVFSPGLGLHAVVSTHVDGVNIYQALIDMKLTNILE